MKAIAKKRRKSGTGGKRGKAAIQPQPSGLQKGRTAGKKMEAALAEREKTIRALLDASPAVEFLVGSEGKILVYNQAFERFFGRDGKPLIGRNIEDLLSPEENQVNTGKTLEVLITGKPVFFEDYQRGLWLEKCFSPILDEEGRVAKIAFYGRDISERKRATEALKENELRYRLLAENVSDYIWTLDRNLRPTYVSPGVTRLLGFTPDQVLGQNLEDRLTPDSVALIKKMYAQEIAKERKGLGGRPQPQILVMEYRRKDGSTFWAETRVRPVFDPEGKIVSFVGITHDISDRKKAEEALRESERTIRALLDASPAAEFLIDKEGKILATNKTFDRVYGGDKHPLVGRRINEVIRPEENKTNLDKVLEVFRTKKPVFFEDRQEGLWLEKGFYPVLDEKGEVEKIACYGRDITARKRAQEASEEIEKRYRLLADNLTEAIWTMDLNLRPTYVSPGLARARGYRVEESMAQSLEEQLTPESCAYALKVFAEEMTEEQKESKDLSRSRTLELEYRCRDGSTLWAESRVTAIRDEKGQITGILGTSRNISERKTGEQELVDYQVYLEKTIEERTARIQDLERQRGEIEKLAATGLLAARIAHEINNPLAGIKGAFMLIKDSIPTENPYYHYVNRIQNEINRIARVVRQMFELYRPPEDDQEEWGMEQMVQDVVTLLEDEARERKVSFQIHIPPLKLRLPAGPIRQVFFNVIKNAVEASPMEGLVHISVQGREKGIHIQVVDQGPGISEKARPYIFEPFFTTKKGRQGGLGLGLSITNDIVESLGGSIDLQSLEGKGVLCQIDFPQGKTKEGE